MNNSLLQVCGLAARARKICYGQTLFEKMRKNQVRYLIISDDVSQRSLKQLISKANHYQVDYYQGVASDQLSKAIGKTNIKAIGITDVSFKYLIIKNEKKEEK